MSEITRLANQTFGQLTTQQWVTFLGGICLVTYLTIMFGGRSR